MSRYAQDRASAILWARKALEKPFVVVDTETTGLEEHDQVLQVGVVASTGHVIFECILNPVSTQISQQAMAVHNISQDVVDFAPTFPRIALLLAEVFRNYPVYAYSAEFDQKMLEQTAHAWKISLQVPTFRDVKEPFARFYGDWDMRYTSYRWQKLTAAAQFLGIEVNASHSAAADALTTLKVIEAMARADKELSEERK